ncbi:MAG TPA: tetratricopeptide repeat protein, partial [Terriglobales bacterium]|nr:tetratricopeptide repeat protein [Terriglobales bacterium]
LERGSGAADASACPQFLHKRVESLGGLGLQNVKYFTAGGMAAAEYLVPEVQGYKLRQQHLIACTAREDVYVDVHLSKTQFKQEEEPLFTSLINSVTIAGSPSTTAGSKPSDTRELMDAGNRYFLQQHYKEAIVPYQQALDLEKKNRSLDKTMWRVLVDNLGMAYGITGDLANAEATFRYGMAEDSTYPMFLYNMACVYAERNDLDNAMEYLRKAFSYKANLIPGEKMPDPQSDDSFQRFRANPKFQALMDSLKSAK